MPPSTPPASVLSRRYWLVVGVPADRVVGLAPPPSGDLEAVADLDALDGLDAHHAPGRAARRACGPSGRGCRGRPARRTPSTSTMPPSESPSLAAALISAIIASAPLGVEAAHLATRRRRPGRRTSGGRPAPTCARPIWIDVRDDLDAELRRAASWRAAPAATRAAVSRALARSSTSRASVKPYFCMPARSAWPGRTWVSGSLVAPGAGTSPRATCRCGTTRCS